jgi:hypothetical protein
MRKINDLKLGERIEVASVKLIPSDLKTYESKAKPDIIVHSEICYISDDLILLKIEYSHPTAGRFEDQTDIVRVLELIET